MQSPEREIAIHAARQAGRLLCQNYGKAHHIEHKGATNLVTETDYQSQQLIVELLSEAFPTYGVVAEEQELASRTALPVHWLVDPLDGTTNYAHAFPFFGVSIALVKDNEPVLGVVYNPRLEELFVAEKDLGATLNGSPIHVSQTSALGEALITSGFPYNTWTTPNDNLAEWARVIKHAQALRCTGVASLDLCHVAAGRVDGYWDDDLGAWDFAAGIVIVAEAGGKVTTMQGTPIRPIHGGVLATNGLIHADLLAILLSE